MPEPTDVTRLLLSAFLASAAGMGWWALSMQVHAQQVWGHALPVTTTWLLRVLAITALAMALWRCLLADHASMAALVWVMLLMAAAMLIAFILTWRASCLSVLAPWLRTGSTAGRPTH